MNGLLSGLSLDGTHYFYENPLTDDGSRERQSWYTVSCCPPNLARTISSLERYLYAQRGREVWVNQYVGSRATLAMPGGATLDLTMTSGLPWEGEVGLSIDVSKPTDATLLLRVPAWASDTEIRVNGEVVAAGAELAPPSSYVPIARRWKRGDTVFARFGMETRLVESPPEVVENQGRVAIVRGPLVYALEDQDNGFDVHTTRIGADVPLVTPAPAGLDGVVSALAGATQDGLPYTAIPYYAWANRGRSNMEVWLHR
jgi:DUF1680 family protein